VTSSWSFIRQYNCVMTVMYMHNCFLMFVINKTGMTLLETDTAIE